MRGKKQASVAFSPQLIIAEESSSVVVVESWHSLPGSQAGFTNAVTEAFTGRNAKLELVKLQLEDRSALHIGHTQATVQRDATFNINTITLGGALVRNNLGILLSEEHATAHLFGLYLLSGNQHVDNHTLVDHAVPHGLSNELYKGYSISSRKASSAARSSSARTRKRPTRISRTRISLLATMP